ncbi:MAG: DoxX family protein [Candidatus Dadabacteria bacterium]|nr:DoxX family protein [Candidatus Dadabacteria bacterium]
MIRRFIGTDVNDVAALIARVALGVVMLPHGLQKLLGMLGGYGFSATVGAFTGMGIPAPVAVLVILAESFGALFLILGFISRFSAFGVGLVMLGAMLTVHAQFGFFMNWYGSAAGEGFEYHILALGLALIVLIRGGGKWSADGVIGRGRE